MSQYQPVDETGRPVYAPTYGAGAPPPQQQYQQPPPQQYGVPQQPTYQPAYQQHPPQQQQQQQQQYQQQQQPYKGSEAANAPLVEQERFAEGSEYRDKWFAVFWLLHIVVVVIVGIVFFSKYKDCITNNENCPGSDSDFSSYHDSGTSDDDDIDTLKINGQFYGLLAASIVFGAVMAAGWIYAIQAYAKQLVWFTLGFSVVVEAILAVVFFMSGAAAGGVIMLVLVAFNILYIYLVRRRIAFAAAMLEIVAGVVRRFPSMIFITIGFVFVQALWAIVWFFTAISSLNAVDSKSSGTRDFVYVILLVSFYWTATVLKNIVHVTCSGTIATWAFSDDAQMPENPTKASLKRATTTSLGSIAFGSLIIALIKTARQLVRQARRSRNNFARACAACVLGCLDRMVEFFNHYAFTFCAIYGMSFVEASKATWALLKSRGMMVIINDDLTSGVLAFAALIGGCMTALFTGLLLAHVVVDTPGSLWIFYLLVGFLVGYFMTICAMEVMYSGVSTIYVVWAADPAAFQAARPDCHNSLTAAFQQFYPNMNQQQQQQQRNGV